MIKIVNGVEVEMSADEISEFEAARAPLQIPTVADYQTAIQDAVDDAARSKLFNDGVTLASYIGSTVEIWREQAKAFVAWRDNVWQYTYSELAKVKGGVRPQPTVADFLLELPEIVWP